MADSCLTLFVTNFGIVRHVESNGRDYYVAPVTLIVPGVLPGSLGPVLYPRDEVAMSVNRREGVDLTLDHPQSVGKRIVVGMVRNPKIRGGNLVAEAWIDAALAKKADNRILESLRRNENMEVSTGLMVLQEHKEGVWKGREYHAIARNYKPDHLALLPDKIGACSVKDGCGLNVVNCICTQTGVKAMTDIQNDRQDILPVPAWNQFTKSEDVPGEQHAPASNPFAEPLRYVEHVPRSERQDYLPLPVMNWNDEEAPPKPVRNENWHSFAIFGQDANRFAGRDVPSPPQDQDYLPPTPEMQW